MKELTSWDKMVLSRVNDLTTNYNVDVRAEAIGNDEFKLFIDGDVLKYDGEALINYINGMIKMGIILDKKNLVEIGVANVKALVNDPTQDELHKVVKDIAKELNINFDTLRKYAESEIVFQLPVGIEI
jgi:hypothetical protein